MEQKILGTALATSAFGLGCMGFSQAYGPADDDESVAVVRDALDRGITMIDTAMSYGGGHNERLVGRAIAGRRDDVVLATKFGIVRGADGVHLDGRPENVRGVLRGLAERLGVDTIDLYYLHRVDPEVPVAETIGAMADLVAAGKVRHLGRLARSIRPSSSRPPRCTRSPPCSSSGRCPGASPRTTWSRPPGGWPSGWCRTARSAEAC